MLEIYTVAIFLAKASFHINKQIIITIYSLTALAAYQVMMMPFFGVMIYRPVIQFAFIDATGFFK
jgi:hypothetical protein